ncbi:enhanced intracellular survival protein Eis [Rhodococcus hoagii]|uniref:enhanced intracellular survival protein Eis n=1 Tax=Rhodococcus hoagii TaxID=43767 RepID=UPI0019634342|nr:enhanced intracellular survival protein Eis [Prescottella equi]MBM9838818.1 enhanced intracellular survival protein Eis [Prescottella equi]NKR57534.1 enhanced intracellular survival protein Eis [Prescottella equi]NKS48382.1 enhanced intracellular survival protein Eis [Prescottella equi]NKT06866.1 enhanced intracellular survival protein Eis [Prescottella equi]
MTSAEGIQVRAATESDWPAIELLDAVGFGYHPAEPDRTLGRALNRIDDIVVATDDGNPVGVALHLPLELTVPGGHRAATRGVSWVSVAPTHRRRGVLRAMFTHLHREIAATGVPLSALTASEGGIYGRFGYGPATVVSDVTLDRRFARFRDDAPDPGGVRVVDATTAARHLPEIYDRWRRITPGAQARPEPHWEFTFTDPESGRGGGTGLFFLLHPDGYAMFRRRGDGDARTAVVEELIAVTDDAHAALWRALCGLDLMVRVEASTHPDDSLRHMLTDPRLVRTTRVVDDLWLRIMDVPAALEARTYALDLDTVVEVRDPYLDAGGTYALTVRDGHAQCRRTDASPTISLDLEVLGSLYLGGHHARPFAAAGRVRAMSDRELTQFDLAFRAERPAVLGWGF